LAEIRVRVTARARETGLVEWRDGILRVKVKEPAEKGRANEAVGRLLAKALGVPPSSVALKRGPTARDKVFEIAGMDQDEAARRLKEKSS
jgi:uncharacterized protein (TIGR00251 family)